MGMFFLANLDSIWCSLFPASLQKSQTLNLSFLQNSGQVDGKPNEFNER